MMFRSMHKIIATALLLLVAGTVEANVKQHTRTPEESWDFEVAVKADVW